MLKINIRDAVELEVCRVAIYIRIFHKELYYKWSGPRIDWEE